MQSFHLLPLPFLGGGTHLHYIQDAAGVVVDPHHHLYHEFDYILKGHGVFAVGGRKVNVKPGDIFYLARGVYHWRMSDADDPLELCNLTLSEKDMLRLLTAQPEDEGAEWPWWRHWSRAELTGAEAQAFLTTLLGLMRKKHHTVRIRPEPNPGQTRQPRPRDNPLSPADIEQLIPGLAGLLTLARGSNAPSTALHALAQRVRRAPHERLSLDAEAARLGVTRWWLSRVFKRRFGVTLWQHRDYARTDLAIQRLLASDITVGELGRSLGFRGTAQFIATFKRLVGLTPGHLRWKYTRTPSG